MFPADFLSQDPPDPADNRRLFFYRLFDRPNSPNRRPCCGSSFFVVRIWRNRGWSNIRFASHSVIDFDSDSDFDSIVVLSFIHHHLISIVLHRYRVELFTALIIPDITTCHLGVIRFRTIGLFFHKQADRLILCDQSCEFLIPISHSSLFLRGYFGGNWMDLTLHLRLLELALCWHFILVATQIM